MRIVVTRPEPECGLWAHALVERGLQAVALPLIHIGPVADTTALQRCWRDLARHDAVMFVSGAAVVHFFALRPQEAPAVGADGPGATRFWAPGPGTAAALLHQGVDPALVDAPDAAGGQFDSEALWRVVAAQVRPGHHVLIVRGADDADGESARGGGEAAAGSGRDWLARTLQLAGAKVSFVVAYARGAPPWSDAQRQLARAAALDGSVWLFTSSQALAHLADCLPQQRWDRARALVTHPRIAQAARAAGFGVVWESRPRLDDVVASIESNR